MAELTPAARLEDADPLHVLDVRTGDEGLLAGRREDDDPRRLVGREFLEAGTKILHVREIDRVERVLPIDGDCGDAAVALDVDGQKARPRREAAT